MKIKITPDKQKADSLKKIAEITLQRLDNTDKESYPTNTLIDYYDIIHKLMEALTLKKGVKIKGEGAHQQLIDYISEKYSFNESTRNFLQEIRDLRNKISYEGFMINKNFIHQNNDRILNIVSKSKKALQ